MQLNGVVYDIRHHRFFLSLLHHTDSCISLIFFVPFQSASNLQIKPNIFDRRDEIQCMCLEVFFYWTFESYFKNQISSMMPFTFSNRSCNKRFLWMLSLSFVHFKSFWITFCYASKILFYWTVYFFLCSSVSIFVWIWSFTLINI